MIRTIVNFLTAMLIAAGMTGCMQEVRSVDRKEDSFADITVLASLGAMQSKSSVQSEDRISEMTLASYDRNGLLERAVYLSLQDTGTLNLDYRADHHIAVLANLGDLTASLPAVKGQLDSFKVSLPSYGYMEEKGLPAAGIAQLGAFWDRTEALQVDIRRLAAKVELTIRHARLCDTATTAIVNRSVRIRQVNRTLRPFADSRAEALTDLFPDEEVFCDNALSASGGSAPEQSITLYLPENKKGKLIEHNSDPHHKVPKYMERDSLLASYIEVGADKAGEADGVSGDLTYRFYLGSDNVQNFDVEGNCRYTVTLDLSWKGMFLADNWKVTRDRWNDGRTLYLAENDERIDSLKIVASDTPGRVEAEVVFLCNGEPVRYGRDHPDRYPYGWVLTVDGEEIPSGVDSGELPDYGLKWRFEDGPVEKLVFETAEMPVVGASCPVRLETWDGQKVWEGNVRVVPETLEGSWLAKPEYVAQKGRLQVTRLVPGGSVRFSVKEGEDVVRIDDKGDNTAEVSVLKAGTATLHFESSATRQTGDVTVAVKAPLLKFGEARYTVNPDGTEVPMSVYYTAADGHTAMTVGSASATGNYFDASLYEECLAPVFSVDNDYAAVSGASEIYVAALTGRNGGEIPLGVVAGKVEAAARSRDAGVLPVAAEIFVTDPFKECSPDTFMGNFDDKCMAMYGAEVSSTSSGCPLQNIVCRPEQLAMEARYVKGSGDYLNSVEAEPEDGRLKITFHDRPSGDRFPEHFGGKHHVFASVRNKWSGKTLTARQIGYIQVYVHFAVGGYERQIEYRSANLSAVPGTYTDKSGSSIGFSAGTAIYAGWANESRLRQMGPVDRIEAAANSGTWEVGYRVWSNNGVFFTGAKNLQSDYWYFGAYSYNRKMNLPLYWVGGIFLGSDKDESRTVDYHYEHADNTAPIGIYRNHGTLLQSGEELDFQYPSGDHDASGKGFYRVGYYKDIVPGDNGWLK